MLQKSTASFFNPLSLYLSLSLSLSLSDPTVDLWAGWAWGSGSMYLPIGGIYEHY